MVTFGCGKRSGQHRFDFNISTFQMSESSCFPSQQLVMAWKAGMNSDAQLIPNTIQSRTGEAVVDDYVRCMATPLQLPTFSITYNLDVGTC